MNPNTPQNIQEVITLLTPSWQTVKSILTNIGISFAASVAAYLLIPDTAVMTKQEIEDNVQLASRELLLRKSAVIVIALSLKHAATKLPGQISTIFKVPGVESKLRAAASMLTSAPAFWLSYKTIEARVTSSTPTLNIREIAPQGAPYGALTAATFLGSAIPTILKYKPV